MKKGKQKFVIILFAISLLIIAFMDIWLVFKMTSKQTRDMGGYQLESIGRELENTISSAEKLTMHMGLMAEQYIGDEQAISDFIYQQLDVLTSEENGVFNIYIAGHGWGVLPGLSDPDNFDATKRDWYIGAAKNPGVTYVTSPYIDVVTGDMCYTVSVMLADGDSVIAIDYTMNMIQNYIKQMDTDGSSDAVILTGDGIIVGCTDETLIGENISSSIPEYVRAFSLAKNKDGVATVKIKKDGMTENLFAARSNNGWYLIIGESDWKLYKDSYIQLMVTAGISVAVFVIILLLYLFAAENQKKAEAALNSKNEFLNRITGELQEPLNRIMESSGRANVKAMEDYEETFAGIHSAGEKLSDMIGQIMSYSSIVRTEKKKNDNKKIRVSGINKNVRNMILLFMIIVMTISLYTNISATYRWGNEMMQKEASKYEYQVSEWVNTQKILLDMYCSEFSTRPDMLDDYEGTVEYLRKVTEQYPEISVSYMTNPLLEHTVYMNNGWEPDADWHVEERQWYIDTLNSDTGWSISSPYYDEQTGGYCITISQRVYSADTGEFLGIFGIDFFMDKLVDILGDSYTDTGYAFLVDPQGDIVNHPYGNYQMSQYITKNVSDSPYSNVEINNDRTTVIKDYDNSHRILVAAENKDSHFCVYVVASVWEIYGRVVIYGLICLIAFLIAIIMIYRLLSDLIRWQNETNMRMKESADAAIAAGKAKSQFLAQMSHEIRTPINAVLGMNEMILRESDDKDILDYSHNIQSAGKTLLSLINSILDFSKIEDGKMEILEIKYYVSDVINNLVNSIQERARAKSLEFEVNVDENIPSVLMGDDVRLTQVIMNLLTNAVKYTEKGKITLLIKNEELTEDEVCLYVEVRDTGIGIKDEDMHKLFESFERIEEKRNRNIEGTGLGMAIVTKLLDMMGSKLEVESVYGEGSAFSFRIKQEIVDTTPIGNYHERIESRIEASEEKKELYVPKARILVVDDNDMNIKVAKNLMKLNGFIPDTCMSGEECLEILRKNTYDIVFLDHMMPKMDGIETLKHIQEEKLVSDGTHVIALTANAVNGAKEMYIEAGFEDYLSKPIEIPDLVEILIKYLPKELMEYKESTDTKVEDKESADKKVKDEGSRLDKKDGIDKNTLNFDNADDTDDTDETDNTDGQNTYKDISGLPIIDGLDWRYASDHIPTVDMIVDTVKEFRKVMISHANKLESFYNELPDEEAMISYRIQVHAMKSSAATIGITPLSGMAKILEDAANDKNEDRIRKLHSTFIEEWVNFKDKLSYFADEKSEDELKAYNKEETSILLKEIKDAMAEFDIDRADAACNALMAYKFPDELKNKIEELCVAVANIDDDTSISIIDEIM